MGCPVIHSEIGTIDGVRSRRFYSDLFGWEVDVDGAGYNPVRAGAVEGIPGGMVQTPAETAPRVTFYVAVDDIEESLARAAELDATRIMEEPGRSPGWVISRCSATPPAT
jgi:predicted enzyme related to lactoylglutathione lyase